MAWPRLLTDVLPALDASPWADRWILGGGTALAIQIDHRRSDDIDIFFENVGGSPLLHFAPPNNPRTRAICDRWQFPGHYVKLERTDGEIDFLSTEPLSPHPYTSATVLGRAIRLHTPTEIIAKKLVHRASLLKARDVFDLLATAHAGVLDIQFISTTPLIDRPKLRDSMLDLRTTYPQQISALDVTPTYRSLAAVLPIEDALAIIGSQQAVHRSSPRPRRESDIER